MVAAKVRREAAAVAGKPGSPKPGRSKSRKVLV
jgi:hypothetical protein